VDSQINKAGLQKPRFVFIQRGFFVCRIRSVYGSDPYRSHADGNKRGLAEKIANPVG